jgi:hypothetical protein
MLLIQRGALVRAVRPHCERISQSWHVHIQLSLQLLQSLRFLSFCVRTKGRRLDGNDFLSSRSYRNCEAETC